MIYPHKRSRDGLERSMDSKIREGRGRDDLAIL
jgi:hypothetical protein